MSSQGPDDGRERNESLPGVISLGKEPDIEVERILLGTLLHYSGENFPDVLDVGLRPQDFYRETHGEIFAAMADLYNTNEPIDIPILKEKLLQRKTLSQIGGEAYLEDMFMQAATMFHTKQYAKIVVDRSTVRRLLKASADTIQKCEETPSSAELVLDDAEAAIFKIRDTRLSTSLVYLPDSLNSVYDTIMSLKDLKGSLSGIPTGFNHLDFLTGGFQRTDLIILGGRPGMGKTAITLNLALNAAIPSIRQGFRTMPPSTVLFFSLEMGREQIIMRILCQLGRFDLLKMRTGRLTEAEYSRVLEVMAKLKAAPIYIDDSSGQKLRPMDLRAKARRLQRKLGATGLPPLGLIVVDYLQLLSPNQEHNNREREVAEISAGLKSLAKELNVVVLCCSQLKRADVGKPDLADLRDSGAIEQDADMVCFILRKEVLHPDKPEHAGKGELQIKKHRNGPIDTVDLNFLREFSCFIPAQYEKIEDSRALAPGPEDPYSKALMESGGDEEED
jgi:replicative DNA helicase